ncbi:centrosomal protein of 68 kDa isoform X2 [Xyrichtys novacula]|uniref:Centrosomal protein of 68 kDa isoform X2 n=1 Tax=Xyrichtys novacula TaxID=13765 RepID=A0AAV1FA86_XYRNO|nr:centrosomal protein of 68 kDa isoform X2 [Xyrichtys novacula]
MSSESIMGALSCADISAPSASREDLDSPFTVSELRSRLFSEEPGFQSSLTGSRSTQHSFTGPIMEVQRLNLPLRPLLTSTVMHPTYNPLLGKHRGDQTQLRLGQRQGGVKGQTICYSAGGRIRKQSMSSHQANYWACAIPKPLPPSPDRHSASWDPNREYQALLDYTYPLRPGQVGSEWHTSELQEESLLQTDPNLQDSGIDLDHLCSSPNLSGLSSGEIRGRSTLVEGHRSPDLQGSISSSNGLSSDPIGLFLDSQDCRKNTGGNNLYTKTQHQHQPHVVSSSAFRCSTSFLPWSRCVRKDLDEEFWPLPKQLEELQQLSHQVRKVTAQVSQNVKASQETLEPGTTSILYSITLPKKQETEDLEPEDKHEDTVEEKDETGRGERGTTHKAALDYTVSEAVRTSTGALAEPVGGGLSQHSLREVEGLVQQLSGLTLSGSQEDQRQRDSLIHHIKVFCSHLEQLIQRLYVVSERMELLAVPSVNTDSVKSSLAVYQSFQREMSSHQPLVSCVLETGQLLLNCINLTSPFLRDALSFIERQSGALEDHTEHFFSSILSAMDSLTQPSPLQQSREGDLGSGEIQGPS